MRLLNAETLRLEQFAGPDIPPYAILSHTWGKDEITLQELSDESIRSGTRLEKIRQACSLSLLGGLDYCWVDTCCIDKTSSAELSEAINSMFRWYQNAAVCLVFLSDLEATGSLKENLAHCRWFTRGWTLQELLAPNFLLFYDKHWTLRGTVAVRTRNSYVFLARWLPGHSDPVFEGDLHEEVCRITGVPPSALRRLGALRAIPAAQVMSWASSRNTTRIEDAAYSLLGLFEVHMPLLYGEGWGAFARLQEEIFKRSGDLSLLAWEYTESDYDYCGVMARWPKNFSWCLGLALSTQPGRNTGVEMTYRGLRVTNPTMLSYKASIEKATEMQTYFHHLLDLNLVARSQHEQVWNDRSTVPSTWDMCRLRLGIHERPYHDGVKFVCIELRKYGPDLFHRLRKDGKLEKLVIEDRDAAPSISSLGGGRERSIYLNARSMWYEDNLYQKLGMFRAPDPAYDLGRKLEIHFPPQEGVILETVANGSLWDASTRSFIRSQSNHTGWDALVFSLRDPTFRYQCELSERIVVFVLFLDQDTPLLVVSTKGDDRSQCSKVLSSPAMGVNELLSWQTLQSRTKMAALEAKARAEDCEASLRALSDNGNLSSNPTALTGTQDRMLLAISEDEIRSRPLAGGALTTTVAGFSGKQVGVFGCLDFMPIQGIPQSLPQHFRTPTFILSIAVLPETMVL